MRLPTRHLIEVMGTVVTIDFFASETSPERDEALRVAEVVLRDVDRTFSTWKPESPVSRLRRGEVSLAHVPSDVADVLGECRRLKDLTRGWFDPWALPGGVDPTGMVKGWAAQRCLRALDSVEASGIIVNAGGDIAVRGLDEEGRVFRVGVTNPADEMALIAAVEVTSAIATSGESQRGAHLYNTRDHVFRSSLASGTVVGPDLATCDALATALVVGGDEVMEIIHHLDDYFALSVDRNGDLRATPGFPLADQ